MVRPVISFAGAGRVASSLAAKLSGSGFQIALIHTPSDKNGPKLARECNAAWSPVPDFQDSGDLVVVSVPDHALGGVLESLKCRHDTLVVHTAGSYGLDIFPSRIERRGVLYPLQTFSAGRRIDYTGLPFLLEASDERSGIILSELVSSIGSDAWYFTTEQRRIIHLAAVFVSNFTNHMLAAGREVADTAGLPFGIFRPLLEETVSKALEAGPALSQTGPAVRGDKDTIDKHIGLLSFSSDLQAVYRTITESIIKHHNRQNNG